MHVLLTGASGNVGRHLLAALLANAHRVTAVHRSASNLVPGQDLGSDRLRWVRQDLAQGTGALPLDYDVVIHAAAHAPPRANSASAHVKHNVISTRNVVEHAARRAGRRFIFLSSISVLGRISVSEVDHTTPSQSPCSYGLSKLVGEQLLAEAGPKLAAISLRLPGVVATGGKGPWIERIYGDIRAQRTFNVHSLNNPFNNFIPITDLATFTLRLMDQIQPGYDVLTLAAVKPLPLQRVIEELALASGVRAKPVVVPAIQQPFTISSQRAIKYYGYTPLSVLAAIACLTGAPGSSFLPPTAFIPSSA